MSPKSADHGPDARVVRRTQHDGLQVFGLQTAAALQARSAGGSALFGRHFGCRRATR
jgi:hypothetical protein